jgi:hypothetical protein
VIIGDPCKHFVPLRRRIGLARILLSLFVVAHHNCRRLLKAMGVMTPEVRCMVPIHYKELHGKKLVDVVKSECGNKELGTALQFLAVNPPEAECMMIDKACKGVGTDEYLLCTIISGRTNVEMELLKVGTCIRAYMLECKYVCHVFASCTHRVL